jgi:hypothetical protein
MAVPYYSVFSRRLVAHRSPQSPTHFRYMTAVASPAEINDLLREASKVFMRSLACASFGKVFDTTEDVDAIKAVRSTFEETQQVWSTQEEDVRSLIRGP